MRNYLKNIQTLVLLTISLSIAGCGGGGSSSDSGSVSGAGSCGIVGAKLSPRIFNGTTCSQDSRTPVVHVILGDSGGNAKFECTGTFISVTSILTSAHCLEGSQTAEIIVGGNETIPIVGAQPHPLYDGNAGSRYDIGILRISRSPNPPVGPLPILLSQLTKPGQKMTAYGYGLTNGGNSGELKALNVIINDIQNGNLIVDIADQDGSICPGDSGGPVVQVINGVAALVGVNSFVSEAGCEKAAANFSGFVDIQSQQLVDFIGAYVPDAAYL